MTAIIAARNPTIMVASGPLKRDTSIA